MAYNVIFTLTSAGLDSGPFNISGTTSSNVTVEIANNVSKSTLQAGYEVTISNDNITGGTVASTGVCTNTQSWVKPTGATPTPTPNSITTYGPGSGYGNLPAGACNDATINNRTLYSSCDPGSFGVGCIVYVDGAGNTPLTGYNYVFIGGLLSTWDINSSTGQIIAYSSEQC
jgi:hypothetical protein